MKKAIFLHPVSKIIRGIGIKNQLLKRRGETFNKEFDQQSAQICAGSTIDPICESTQGAWCGKLTISADNGLNQRIISQFMMAFEIFMHGNQSQNSWTKHAQTGMFNFPGLANVKRIRQFTDATGQTEFAVEFFHKKQTAVTADVAAIEIEFGFSAFRALKEAIS